jgi:hypothetical protein
LSVLRSSQPHFCLSVERYHYLICRIALEFLGRARLEIDLLAAKVRGGAIHFLPKRLMPFLRPMMSTVKIAESVGVRLIVFLAAIWLAGRPAEAALRADGELRVEIVDSETGQPLAARIHLQNSRRRPVKLRLPGSAEFGSHFYIDGSTTLPLRAGQYTFEIEATPEYRTQSGHFEIERHADDSKTIEMRRFANLAAEGWWAGDLDMSRKIADMPLVMRAEGLVVVPVHGAKKIDGKISKPLGDLLLLNLKESLNLKNAFNGHTSLAVLQDAHEVGGMVVARTPFAWDLPVWLASGKLDAIMLINHHSRRDGAQDDEKDGRPRDRSLFPGPTGNGRWAEAIYYHVLGCGLRIPPAAGSGSGTNDSPVGTNRVYVHCDEEFSHERWWDGLQAGRVFVTNGPLLRPLVHGEPPGYVFSLAGRDSLTLEIGLNLATRVPIEYLEIVKNGEVVFGVRLDELAKSAGRLPPVDFDDSGWFLVRAVTDDRRKYQFASSGPYYVEKNGSPRVSRRSVQFFLDWIDAAEARLRGSKHLDADGRRRLLAEQQLARQFFETLLVTANAD